MFSAASDSAAHSVSRYDPLRNRQFGDFHADRRAMPGFAGQLQPAAGSIDSAQPFVDITQPDPAAEGVLEPFLGHAQPIVDHFDEGAAVSKRRLDGDPAASYFTREPVLDRVFHQRLQ